MEINLAKDVRSTLRISEACLSNSGRGEKVNASSKLQEKGHLFTSVGKVATVLYMDDCQRKGSSFTPDLVDKAENSCCLLVERFCHDNQRFVKVYFFNNLFLTRSTMITMQVVHPELRRFEHQELRRFEGIVFFFFFHIVK